MQIVSLGGGWVAIHRSGQVVLQYVRQVVVAGTGQDFDLERIAQDAEYRTAFNAILSETEDQRLLVRTMVLSSDGSVQVEPHAISLDGLLDPSFAFTLLPSALLSLASRMQDANLREWRKPADEE